MQNFHFTSERDTTPEQLVSTSQDEMALVEGLGQNILAKLGAVELFKRIKIFLHDEDNQVKGGITSSVFGGWVYVEMLWVTASLRGQGYGSQLLARLEDEARQLGCRHAHLDTFSFEARPFYEKAGYQVYAELQDYPPGHSKIYLKKDLA